MPAPSEPISAPALAAWRQIANRPMDFFATPTVKMERSTLAQFIAEIDRLRAELVAAHAELAEAPTEWRGRRARCEEWTL